MIGIDLQMTAGCRIMFCFGPSGASLKVWRARTRAVEKSFGLAQEKPTTRSSNDQGETECAGPRVLLRQRENWEC
jgi:hypothetical protein